LLHICCGVCALHSIDKLKKDAFLVSGFFYNPNIYPFEEYAKRLDAAKEACRIFEIEFFTADYTYDLWLNTCRRYCDQPEGGERCSMCYAIRIKAAFDFAVANGFDYLTSTLTISPYKNSKKIFEIARDICGDKYLPVNFKKEDGFKKTAAFAREFNLYRQNYCGCEFSIYGK